MNKDVKTKSAATLIIVIALAILIIINLIAINLFARIDLTENQIYSLSEASKKLVAGLDDRLTIKAYMTEDLPFPHNDDARYLRDLLDDYRAYSDGNLQYQFIDPAKEDKEQEAQSYRIPPLQFNVFKNEKAEFIKGYKGLVLLYKDQSEVIPFIENTDMLEYDISRAINKLIQDKRPIIAFTTGHGEPTVAEGFNYANQMLQREFQVQYLNLDNLRNIPPEVDALFIVSPQEEFSKWERYLVDQFIMRGGKVAFLIDKFSVQISDQVVIPVDNGLDSLLYFYGAAPKEQLAIDLQCNRIPIVRQMGEYQIQSVTDYPFYLSITNFNENNQIVKEFNTLGMLFISPLEYKLDLLDGQSRQTLFTTSKNAGTRGLPLDISPEKQYFREDFQKSELPLACAITGRFDSYYNVGVPPQYQGTDTLSDIPFPEFTPFTTDSRIIIIGSGSFVKDDFRRNESGFIFLMNMADWLTQDIGLISIRSKQSTARRLNDEALSNATKQVIKYVNILAMPVLVIVFGVVRWRFKRSLKRKRETTL